MIIKVPSNTTILRLVINHRERFHPQDWYFDEPFANDVHPGEYALDVDADPVPALLWVCAFVSGALEAEDLLLDQYVWTSDTDGLGSPVYVGGIKLGKGFQIHRHLKIPPYLFTNRLTS